MKWKVSEIGLGTYPLGGDWGPVDDIKQVIRKAYELGVNFFDTADLYGLGYVETILGKLFSSTEMRRNIYIATKGGRDFYSVPSRISKNFERGYLEMALNQSLKRLKRESVDLYQLHGPGIEKLEQGEVIEFLDQAKKEGKILAAGASLYSLAEVETALSFDVLDSIQYIFNMLSICEVPKVLRLCKQKGVAFIARQPLAQGLLTRKYTVDSHFAPEDFRSKWTKEFKEEALRKVERLGFLITNQRTLAHAAIHFVLSFPDVSIVIPGSKTIQQIESNIQTCETHPLTEDDIRRVWQISCADTEI